MKRSGRATFFIVAAIVLVFTYLSFFGINNYYGETETVYVKGASDIRWGIDIQGGVEAIFTPDVDADYGEITAEDMEAAETIINTRLVNNNITDSEVYSDNDTHSIIVRFPWQSNEENFDPEATVAELGETAQVIFSSGSEQPTDQTILLQGSDDVESATAGYTEDDGYLVQLSLTAQGTKKFASATKTYLNQVISIWLDDKCLSTPTVNAEITDGKAIITGMSDADETKKLAEKINAGAMPFRLKTDDTIQVINPTLGENALNTMLLAGTIAFLIVCLIMMVIYRLPGFVACIALLGQIAGMIACTSGFFGNIDSFTLTIPGIAGIILSIGMGVDANVITAERIKEELRGGKTLDGAIDSGYDNGFSAIFDGNITVIIVSVMLMGVFGPYSGFWAKVLFPFMWLYNHTIGFIPGLAISNTITGSIYSFGFTLLIGVIFNFVMGVTASRLMLKGASRFNFLRKNWLYGGLKNEQ